MAMTEREAVERARQVWPNALNMELFGEGGGELWRVQTPDGAHWLDGNGHVACGHPGCLQAEAAIDHAVASAPAEVRGGGAEATGVARAQRSTCLFCNADMDPPKRKGVVKLFCCDRHRVAHRDRSIGAGLAHVVASMKDLTASLEDMAQALEQSRAAIDGAVMLIQRAMKQPGSRAGRKRID